MGSSGRVGSERGSDFGASPKESGGTAVIGSAGSIEEGVTSSEAFANEAKVVLNIRVASIESIIRFLFFIIFSPSFAG